MIADLLAGNWLHRSFGRVVLLLLPSDIALLASLSAALLPSMFSCPGVHTNSTSICGLDLFLLFSSMIAFLRM